ncbi:uncharacterized protein LOC123541356 [Mercenaria mercenaria]|uniref:uncharacterized protein LOC123541356 n=1 Tax=Mercenaria mercenaria TaxID=6596 RepID=UPI00234E909A|nr:uncharacterized protein LOC123541356 [Mercenaria mercenaria]
MYNVDIFSKIEDEIGQFSQQGRILWIGDLNSRVGQKSDYIENERITGLDFNDFLNDLPSSRTSMDHSSNRFGDYLLDICKSTNICIMNGRSGCNGDNGNFTCFTHNGESLIDYVLTSYGNFKLIRNFNVHNYTEYSNHSPISFEIITGMCKCNNNSQKREFYKWNENDKLAFLNDLSLNIDGITESLQNNYDVEDAVSCFSEYIALTAEKYFKKTIKNVRPTFVDNEISDRKQWFNLECENKRLAYIQALEQYTCDRSAERSDLMKRCKKDYKYCVRKTRKQFNINKGKEMHELRRKNPRDFWKKFKRTRQATDERISLDDFLSHFKSLAQTQDNEFNDDVDMFLDNFDTETDREPMYEELDVPITETEIRKAVKNLNRNKATGIDNLLNEYFIEGVDVLIKPLIVLFNRILNTGKFPRQWSKGVIVPVLKKQPSSDWSLSVNIDKTKIMVFRKGGRLARNEEWTYNGQKIDIVDSFNYLGFVLSTGGSFRKGLETLAAKSLKAMKSD